MRINQVVYTNMAGVGSSSSSSSSNSSSTDPMCRPSTLKSRCNDLSLKMKYEVIKTFERERIGIRKLAAIFGCGKSQISCIIKNKNKIQELFESNASESAHQIRKRERTSKFCDINDALYQWFCLASSKNIYPDGRILIEEAKEILEKLSIQEFKASNGWLDRWKKKHNIKQLKVCGESGDVSGATIASWKERLPHILNGYSAHNIWNLDETGVFWRALPDKGLSERSKQCRGGKKCKQWITVTFIVNAAGESEVKPIVIWKSDNPRCFKGVDKSQLPVLYFSHSKAWMTGEILDAVLSQIDRKLRISGRFVLLLMDNAGCPPQSLMQKYANIKIVFFAP